MANTVDNRKDKKNNNKPNKFVNFFKKIGRGCKEIISELKKVTWPTFGKTMSQTGIVFVVVIFFLVVIACFDLGLNAILQVIIA